MIRQLGKHKYEEAIALMKEQGVSEIKMYKWNGAKGFVSYLVQRGENYIEKRKYFNGTVLEIEYKQ